MKFHSEWLLDDPIEVISDFAKNVHTKEEIEKLSTKEFYSETAKALYLLDTGQLPQKLWVVRAIDTYMNSPNFDKVIAELIDHLPYWNEPAQQEAGSAFVKVLTLNCFPVKYFENLLLLILHIIETETWSLQEQWGEVFFHLAKLYPKRCSTEALTLTSFNASDNFRAIGGYVLSAIVESNKGEKADSYIKKIISLTQDPSSFVRKQMCKALKVLSKVMSREMVENKLVTELLQLIEDDSDEVLESSLPLFAETIEMCGLAAKEKVVGLIKPSFFNAHLGKLAIAKLKYFGKVMASLKSAVDQEFIQIAVGWFASFKNSSEAEVKVLVALNFPALLYIVGRMNDQLFEIFKAIEDDLNWEVKQVFVKTVGDICSISNEPQLMNTVTNLLDDPKTSEFLITQAFSLAKSLNCPTLLFESLLKQLEFHQSDWRRTVKILSSLCLLYASFDCSKFFDKITDLLLDFLQTSCYPIKSLSAQFLAEVFYSSLSKSEDLLNRINASLAASKSHSSRISYLKFCAHMSAICSQKMFCKNYVPNILLLARDPVFDVRYEFLSHYLEYRLALPFGATELQAEFRAVLNSYLESNNLVLIKMSFECDEKVDKVCIQFYNEAQQAREEAKWKAEQERTVKEHVESRIIVPKTLKNSRNSTRGRSHNPVKRNLLAEGEKMDASRFLHKFTRKRKETK